MEIKPGLQQQLALELKLTPALLQNIELLQLPVLELENLIKDEIEANPLIELEDEVEETHREQKENVESVWDFVVDGGNIFVKDDSEVFDPLTIKASPVSLRDRLLKQAHLEFEKDEFEIARFIIDNLDRKGFLAIPVEEVARSLSVPVDKVESVRKKVMHFDPVGCGAVSLVECLKVQAEELGVADKFIRAIEDMETLRKNRKRFLEKTGLTEEELDEFLNILKHLDPQPGMEAETVRITPDLIVYLEGDKPIVKILKTKTFSFRVNSSYLRSADTEKLKRYLTEKYQRALNLKKAIEQRNATLKAIGEAVFFHQIDFLKRGESAIRPLSYREIAEKLSIHESTISRAVKDKFVETPFGVYPFKVFFRRSVSGTSVDVIKEAIKEIIETEDKRKPLSDSKIATMLGKRGIKIARRTVAKYREEMGIPGAFERKEK
ncbi:RNA polymerase factor sigma-54 [Desulfurobacterium sp.]|uniref:RNA polymerase factor sigma-54 n=1 Tax=Desulfurobacterium sp. TaxID=2004706 RepID=UPI0026203D80|nr:RNA polymerase factor sigma-54 [Desulfurobacterium sp.]